MEKKSTSRPVGRPKSRYVEDVRNDLRKMKLTKWTEQVQDRLKQKDTVEKAKTLPEFSAEEEESEEVVFSSYTLVMIQTETLLIAACQNL